MENKLEQLLNSLIEKGWKPRGESEPIYMLSSKKLYIPDTREVNRSLRDLVSKESGLWQFVCKNGYIKEIETDGLEIRNWDNPKHWIVESALCDEDKLEEFLLNSIKLD